MTPPCNGCDCCLPLNADDLCARCAASVVEVIAYVDHPEPRSIVEGEQQDLTEKLDRANVELEQLRVKVGGLEARAVGAEGDAERWRQSAFGLQQRMNEVHHVVTRQPKWEP